MPTIQIPIVKGQSADSITNMAQELGRITKTVVECSTVLHVTANESVIGALRCIAPMAKGTRKRRASAPEEPAAPIQEPEGSPAEEPA